MLNRLAIVGAGVLLCAGVMSGQPNQAAAAKGNRAKQSHPAVVSANGHYENADSQQDQDKSGSHSPSGNASIERPAVWWRDSNWWLVAIAGITGGFICWQSWETRRAADISERVLISDHRPKVRVREVNVRIPGEEPGSADVCGFKLTILNAGGTHAEVQPFEITVELVSGSKADVPISKKRIAGFSLAAGERKTFFVEPDNIASFLVGFHMINGAINQGQKQTTFPVCRGTIIYLDGNKTERRTGFARAFHFLRAQTVPSSDPELEYED